MLTKFTRHISKDKTIRLSIDEIREIIRALKQMNKGKETELGNDLEMVLQGVL